MDPQQADPAPGPGQQPDAGPGLPVAAVARRLGVAPATLRTWARRYGLGPSSHAAGAHRRYTPPDLARLETMRRLTLEGVPPSDAARAALGQSAEVPPRERRARARGGPGGRVLALPGAEEVARGLGRAGMALDARTVTDTVREALASRGVVATWEQVLRPVLVAVGDRWAATGEGVEVEHLLSDCIATALREVAERAHEPLGGRPVLLACAPDEQHALPLYAVAAGLAERGLGSRTLGPALPADALEAAVRRTGPALLFLWSQLRTSASAQVVADLPVMRPPTAVIVGGPGWRGGDLPERVRLVRTLTDALDCAEDAVAG
jgi:DNA-binding transcriptional MerR regulator